MPDGAAAVEKRQARIGYPCYSVRSGFGGTIFFKGDLMLFSAGLLALSLCAFLIRWARPVEGNVSPRVAGYDFPFSTAVCLLLFASIALLMVGLTH
jgi:hypothetical protein